MNNSSLFVSLKKNRALATGSAAVALVVLIFACCARNNPKADPILQGTITSYNEFGAAMLSFTEADMSAAGFTLGDVISISLDSRQLTMPYYDGFYTRNGEFLCVAYPTYPSICFTANNTGLPEEYIGLEGHGVTVKMKKKGGSIDVQKALSMKYTNNRAEYPQLSDAQFANARSVSAGSIAAGRLYRSSSPFSDEIGRAGYVSAFLSQEKVKSVLNLTDNLQKMQGYDMPAYSATLWNSGNVILCPLKADPTADDYNTALIAALKELPSHPAPYVVHCTEGKDRTGYVCALLEGLCGASYQEIVADYLVTYENYFGKTPQKDADVCNALVSLRLNTCLMHYAGVSDESQLPSVNYASAFSSYLLSHGMTQPQLNALIQALE